MWLRPGGLPGLPGLPGSIPGPRGGPRSPRAAHTVDQWSGAAARAPLARSWRARGAGRPAAGHGVRACAGSDARLLRALECGD